MHDIFSSFMNLWSIIASLVCVLQESDGSHAYSVPRSMKIPRKKSSRKVASPSSVSEAHEVTSPRRQSLVSATLSPPGPISNAVKLVLRSLTIADREVLRKSLLVRSSGESGFLMIADVIVREFPAMARSFEPTVSEIMDSYLVFKALADDPDALDPSPRMFGLLRILDALYTIGLWRSSGSSPVDTEQRDILVSQVGRMWESLTRADVWHNEPILV